MPSNAEFQAALERLSIFIDNMGYDKASWEEYDENDVVSCDLIGSENPIFEVNCSPNKEFCSIMFEYNLIRAISGRIDESEADAYIAAGYEDYQEELDKEALAAHSIIDLLDPEDREEIIFQLHESVLSSPVMLSMDNNTVGGNFSQFHIWANIFPYEDDFSITIFNKTIREVFAAGDRATTFLKYAFNLGIEDYIKSETTSEKEIATSPRFPR